MSGGAAKEIPPSAYAYVSFFDCDRYTLGTVQTMSGERIPQALSPLPCASSLCWKYPLRCSRAATIGTPRSAAERSMSPASMPSPPL